MIKYRVKMYYFANAEAGKEFYDAKSFGYKESNNKLWITGFESCKPWKDRWRSTHGYELFKLQS